MGQIWIDGVEVEGYANVVRTPQNAEQIVGEFSLHRDQPGAERVEGALSGLRAVEFRGDLEIDGTLYYAVCQVELFSAVLGTLLSGKFRSRDEPLVLKRVS